MGGERETGGFSGRSVSYKPTDGSKNLTPVLAETCEVKNVNSQQFTSNKSQDTQNNLHSSSSDLALIIDRSK